MSEFKPTIPGSERHWRVTFEPISEVAETIEFTVTESEMDDPKYGGYWKLSMNGIKSSRRVIIEPVEIENSHETERND
jgi:hypothetical protein